jgi:hypothetical protein
LRPVHERVQSDESCGHEESREALEPFAACNPASPDALTLALLLAPLAAAVAFLAHLLVLVGKFL